MLRITTFFLLFFLACQVNAQEEKDTCLASLPATWSVNSEDAVIRIHSNCPVSDVHITVYNRWGEKVFEEKVENGILAIKWDPSELVSGVYVYIMKYNQINAGSVLAKSVSNHITLITKKK